MSEPLIYRLVHATARSLAATAVRNAPEGWTVTIRPPRRSDVQSNLMHARLDEIAKRVVWNGVKMSAEDWKRVFAAELEHVRVVPGLTPGTFVPIGMRTRDMSVKELAAMLLLIEAFAADRGIVFRDQVEARAA